jgi:uncharacterized protein (DUF1684 family)
LLVIHVSALPHPTVHEPTVYPSADPTPGMSIDDADFDADAWASELEEYRAEKDQFFAEHRQSPIPEADREEFEGLTYYDPDPSFRVAARVEPAEGEDTIELEMTQGEPQEYERVAKLVFELDGEEQELYGYEQADPHDDAEDDTTTLFVPFRDGTTGDTTYGAGRYMEFEVEGDLAEADALPLDFNLAYHPFCVYNEAFACPLAPPENTLDVRIEAGERLARSV